MVTLKDISDYGLDNLVMNISHIILRHQTKYLDGKGLQLENTWISPEGCYWLYKFLSPYKGSILINDKVLDLLKQGTNNPDEL